MVSCRGLNARRTEGEPALSARPDAATLGDSIPSIARGDPTTRIHLGMSDSDICDEPTAALQITPHRMIERGARRASLQEQHPPGASDHFVERQMICGVFKILFQQGENLSLPFVPALHREFL